jgi:hypothetical protein
MNYNCPHCGKSIAGRLLRGHPASGERKILPNRAITVCPLCGGQIAANPHPLEKWIAAFLLFPAVLGLQFFQSSQSLFWLVASSVLSVVSVVGLGYLYFTKFKKWPRYRKYETES